MEERFRARLNEMLDDAFCTFVPNDETVERIGQFVAPYSEHLTEPVQRQRCIDYILGLLSNLRRKMGEAIAYIHNQSRLGMQRFIGQTDWDTEPMLERLATDVGQHIGEADGVIVFDPSAFVKKGRESAGVARQWCGRIGKVENCQVGVFMGYVSRQDHALVDARLYLPREWTESRARCKKAGVPNEVRFQTRHHLALEMLDERGESLPHRWIAGDDEMGRSSEFREELRNRNEGYVLAVPSNTRIRDLEIDAPEYSGRGRRPERPFQRVDRWCAALPASAWTVQEVRDGEKGPIQIEAVQRRVTARRGTIAGPEERLLVTRVPCGNGYKHDYYLAYTGVSEASLCELTRVANAEHRVEESIKRCKSEVGMSDYQVRTWRGWHHHIALCLLATWFLAGETRREKKSDPVHNVSGDEKVDRERCGTSVGIHATLA